MRTLAWIGAIALVGCGAAEPREVSLGASSAPPPDSLVDLAAEVRAAGGFVFVGTPEDDATATDSLYADAPYDGVRVEFPRSIATFAVGDALGAAMDSEMLLVAAAGPARLVDDAGNPSSDYVLSDGDPDGWEQRSVPSDGTWLFFTRPNGDDEVIVWRATIEGESASGEGTVEGASTPLDDLRVTP